MSAKEFFREVKAASSENAPDYVTERRKAIRLYCGVSNTRWVLQVRAPFKTKNGKRSEKFILATAYLDHEDLIKLRAAIDSHLLDDIDSVRKMEGLS